LRGRSKRRDSAATRHRIYNKRRRKTSFADPGTRLLISDQRAAHTDIIKEEKTLGRLD
jgi:hypothetical protein